MRKLNKQRGDTGGRITQERGEGWQCKSKDIKKKIKS